MTEQVVTQPTLKDLMGGQPPDLLCPTNFPGVEFSRAIDRGAPITLDPRHLFETQSPGNIPISKADFQRCNSRRYLRRLSDAITGPDFFQTYPLVVCTLYEQGYLWAFLLDGHTRKRAAHKRQISPLSCQALDLSQTRDFIMDQLGSEISEDHVRRIIINSARRVHQPSAHPVYREVLTR